MSFNVNFEGLAGAPKAILCAVRESRTYENGVAGAVDGIRCTIMCYGNGFEKVAVKVLGASMPSITKEEMDARNAAGDFVYCSFDGFSAKIYQGFGEDTSMRVSATAKKLVIANPAASTAKS